MKNTSEAYRHRCHGHRLEARRRPWTFAFKEEFPANYYPWKRLEAHGVEVRWLSIFDDLDQIDAACNGARLLAISFVQYLSGYRVDLERIGEICARRGCSFFVDAIQGLGAFPIDVRAAKHRRSGSRWTQVAAGPGRLRHPLRPQRASGPDRTSGIWLDQRGRLLRLRLPRHDPASRRRQTYECGTLNTIGCYGLRASIEFLLGVGIDNAARAVQALGDRIWEGVTALGFETLGPAFAGNGRGAS